MNAWSATQRAYLEAMGLELFGVNGGKVPRQEALDAPLAPPEIKLPPQLQKHLAQAAKLPFEELAQRVYLPPDLATNPHAKRAFWHVLKGVRSA